MAIPDDTIAEIRARADIVAVIGQHVQLRKAGRNYKGLCPFHGEKTPSFNVHPDKNFFYCFGCQKKGDAFTFVMEYEGKSFMEAAEQLAARFGVVIPKIDESPELRRARGERSAMLDLNRAASAFFRETLAHPQRGAAGRAYLDKRGCDAAIIEKFQLGYGPDDWHQLADYIQAKKLDVELAVRLGLIARQQRAGGFYDRYRDRLVCPVIVPGGEIVGFSARIVGSAPPQPVNPDRGEAPKYINSPESTVYKKSRLLFGLAQARETMASKNRAVLVEGNFDVVTLHQAGITETVAPLGTALTAEQIEQLRRLTREVVLCYDGDRAGRAATRNALELLVAADIPVRVVALPDGEDPDSMVRNHGGEKLAALVDRAQGGIEFYCFEVWGRSKGSADTQATALDDAARFIAKVENPTKRDLILGTLATAMQLDPGVVRKALARAEATMGISRSGDDGFPPRTPQQGYGQRTGGSQFGNRDGNRQGGNSSGSQFGNRNTGNAGGSQFGNRNQGNASGQWVKREGGSQFPNRGNASGSQFPNRGNASGGQFPNRGNSNWGQRSGGSQFPDRGSYGGDPRDGAASYGSDPRGDAPSYGSDPRDSAPPYGSDPRDEDPRDADMRGSYEDPREAMAAEHPNAPSANRAPSAATQNDAARTAGPDNTAGSPTAAPATVRNSSNSSTSSSGPSRVPSKPAPEEELQLLALLADHPGLIASPEADKAFSLLTDAGVRDMYSAARGGEALTDLAPQKLPEKAAQLVLSAKYAANENPKAQLTAMLNNLQHNQTKAGLVQLQTRMAEAQRRGDRELARQLAIEINNARKQVV